MKMEKRNASDSLLRTNYKIPRKDPVLSEVQEKILDEFELPEWEFNTKANGDKLGSSENSSRKRPPEINRIHPSKRPRLTNATLPKELTAKFLPLICRLCDSVFSSNACARTHYVGSKHIKNINAYLKEDAQKNGTIFIEYTPKELEIEPSKLKHCVDCDIKLTSRIHAEQHYSGENHIRVIKNKAAPRHSGFYDDDGKFTRIKKATVDSSGRFGIGEAFAPPAKKTFETIKQKFRCDICNVFVTCNANLQDHLNGQKHKKKLASVIESAPVIEEPKDETRLEDFNISKNLVDKSIGESTPSEYRTPSGAFYCLLCNVTITGEPQFKQHLGSKKHAKNKAAQNNVS